MGAKDEDVLPALNPAIRLYKAASSPDGEPRWTLHHKISNKYYQIGWTEFECLARFHRCKTALEIKQSVEFETTLRVDIAEIKKLVLFLQANGLVASGDQVFSQKDIKKATHRDSLWKKLIHGYLYFTLPLFRPENFLKKTLTHVEFFFSRAFLIAALSLLALGALLTLQKPDEFIHTFIRMFTLEGAILTLVTFTLIKVLHELGHAYAAVRHGVSVPHMGVAFIVLYPVLYTETTASWQLSSPRKRMEIALAGVTVELILAAIFLLLWNFLPGGLLRSLSFNVVAVSLLGSLLINMNPLMRFDGYYVLSDALRIENLHQKAIGFARWTLRRLLFSLHDPEPFDVSDGRKKFLIFFGWAVLIYRFFLFLGIALLVYHLFFKPLGLILMLVELVFFIVLPVWGELRLWWKRRDEILGQQRAKIVVGLCAISLFLCLVPLDTTVSAPAVLHASQYRAFYSPAPALIAELAVQEGQKVGKGEILARLESPILENQWLKAKARYEQIEMMRQRVQTDTALFKERSGKLDEELAAAHEELNALTEQKELLVLKAPFEGTVRDLASEIHEGRAVKTSDLLFRMRQPEGLSVISYIRESDLQRIAPGNHGSFRAASALFGGVPLTVERLEPWSSENLAWPELASVYGGPLPAAFSPTGEIVPLEPVFVVRLKVDGDIKEYQEVATPGRVQIRAKNASLLITGTRAALRILWREMGLG